MPEKKPLEKLTTVPSYQHLAEVYSANTPYFVAVNTQTNLSIYTGVVSQTTDLHPSQVYAYTVFAEHLAVGLAHTLSVIENYDKPAVYRIMSILDPYIEEIPELDFHIPPKSSREVIVEVTREGRVPPQFYFDGTL